MNKNKKGFVLIFSLMLIFLCMFLVMYITNRGTTFVPYATIAIERKQAYILAQSGVQLAISQIIAPKVQQKKETKEDEKKKEPSEEEQVKDMLTVILPTLNRWQEIKLTENIEGIDATIKFCIMCENGKFNLNSFYDFKSKKFINLIKDADSKKAAQDIFKTVKTVMGGKELFGSFEQQLKNRDIFFNDATELLTSAFEPFKNALFYEPPSGDKEGGKIKQPVYLMDLFTVWTSNPQINPWLMSDSVSAVFNFKRAQPGDTQERKKVVAQWLKPFKLKAQWQKDWNSQLSSLYGKEYNSIPKSLQPFLSSTFEANVFSILTYATVGRVTQRLLTIVERLPSKDDDPEDVVIKKVYWL
ncbi:MAG: hypothetical protein WD055_00515 [Candidatus Dependentiae bacterium]